MTSVPYRRPLTEAEHRWLAAPRPQPDLDIQIHPPVELKVPPEIERPAEGAENNIRNLLRRLRQQPTPAKGAQPPAPEPQPEPKSVLKR